jgi:hypothetical protein
LYKPNEEIHRAKFVSSLDIIRLMNSYDGQEKECVKLSLPLRFPAEVLYVFIIFSPEDAGSMFLRNDGIYLQVRTAIRC